MTRCTKGRTYVAYSVSDRGADLALGWRFRGTRVAHRVLLAKFKVSAIDPGNIRAQEEILDPILSAEGESCVDLVGDRRRRDAVSER